MNLNYTKPFRSASTPARPLPVRFSRGWFGGFFLARAKIPDFAASGSVAWPGHEPAPLTTDPSIQAAQRVFKPVKRVGGSFDLSIFSHLGVTHA